jgi:hypothetical protein
MPPMEGCTGEAIRFAKTVPFEFWHDFIFRKKKIFSAQET